MTNVQPNELAAQSIDLLAHGGIFLVTGTSGNPMTIGWGSIGHLWSRPVFQVMVRPSRYSYELLDGLGEFTVCIPTPQMKRALGVCGSKSGRDTDKIAACGLTLTPSEHVEVPFIAECSSHFECRVIHATDLVPAELDPGVVASGYAEGDFHRMYYGQILGAYRH